MNIRPLILVFILSFFKPLESIYGDPAAITQEELVRCTQELFDAVVPGNKEPWQKYFADDCIFADEKGRNFNKTQLVADITALPKGYSGTIKIVKPKSVIHGDTAILSYDLDETETIFGQKLTARYHVTDTWLRRNGVWQIASSQAMRYYEDPTVARIDSKKFADFTGIYELAPGQIRRVFSEGENLYVERNGKREQLLPEGSEIFFRKGVEGRILFRYADSGKVDALIDRRNNEDVVWRRVN
ncbi:MAG TPA: nuclear transport factor 2 family protein [Candidatus Udaeobacter sp.]|nr:nuclear transport factor 2 family protein [Candidatus Udaeobacter sp.]